MLELGSDSNIRIPRPLLRVALAMVRRSVRKRAGFEIEAVAPLDRVGECFVPVLFGERERRGSRAGLGWAGLGWAGLGWAGWGSHRSAAGVFIVAKRWSRGRVIRLTVTCRHTRRFQHPWRQPLP